MYNAHMAEPERQDDLLNPRLLRSEFLRRCTLGECKGACCLHGVWVTRAEKERILEHAAAVQAWLPETLRDPVVWFDDDEDSDTILFEETVFHTNVLPEREHYGGTACVFWMMDGRCALQCAGQAMGLHPWTLKPVYCVLHPLDIDEEGRLTLAETAEVLQEPASCLRKADSPQVLTEVFAEELAWLRGSSVFRFHKSQEEKDG